MANLDYDIPMTPRSVVYIASTSKQFTAACVALLILRGEISLEDDIRKYFPEIPDYGNPVKVKNLLHHTSGIRDYLGLMSLAGLSVRGLFRQRYRRRANRPAKSAQFCARTGIQLQQFRICPPGGAGEAGERQDPPRIRRREYLRTVGYGRQPLQRRPVARRKKQGHQLPSP